MLKKFFKRKYNFRVRPGYGSNELLIEFMGDHRSRFYPDIIKLLEKKYNASHKTKKNINGYINYILASDHFIWEMKCDKGEFTVDDQWCGLFIHAEGKNQPIIKDIENILLENKHFEKEEVDFSKYIQRQV